MKNPLAIVTIVSNNYLHYARTLLQSVARQHPDATRYCVVVDRDLTHAQALAAEFNTIPLEALHLPDGDDFLFQYTVLELNTAVKPWAMQHLLEKGHSQVIYIDPDIALYQPLSHVVELFERGGDIVLTPHLLSPMDDGCRPSELDIRRAGTYNLGFCALRNTANALNMLNWWQQKLKRDCVVDFERGVFVDQSWMDLVPGLFDNVQILRHPGYNVAYWNLAERQVAEQGGCLTVNGQVLVFFHFSGFSPLQPESVSKHQDRFTLDSFIPGLQSLFRSYGATVIDNGFADFKTLPYAFADFADTSPITAAQRSRYRQDLALRARCQGKPFTHPEFFRDTRLGGVDAWSSLDPLFRRRLNLVYQALLGRMPESQVASSAASRLGSKLGTVRLVLGVGFSREARSTPGWVARLLRLANEVNFNPPALKRWVTQPLDRAIDRLARRWPALAYRPAQPLTPPPMLPANPRVMHFGAPLTPLAALSCPAGINLIGYLKAELGVGEAARSLARACDAAGIAFSAVDVGYQSQNLQRDDSIMARACTTRFAIDVLYVNADQTLATDQQLQATGRAPADYTIGFWHWEQPELPPHHLPAFAPLDEVWVPSGFVLDAVAAVSPVPVYKVPHAIAVSTTPGLGRDHFGLPPDQVLALVMYDFHSYQQRKNPQAAVAAYRLAATKNPSLGLVIKTINSEHHPEVFATLKAQVADLKNVIFINDFFTRQETWDLQNQCDILLSLHRAEGFGLPLAEMMYLGKPVIATGWSANMDFMTEHNSMPVRYTLKPLVEAVGAYPAGPVWADADVEHAAWCLDALARDLRLRTALGNVAAADIRRSYSAQAVGALVRQRLQALAHYQPALLRL